MEIFQSVGQELLMMHRLINFVREPRIPGSASFSKFQQAWRDSVSTGGFINFDTRKYPSDEGIPDRSE